MKPTGNFAVSLGFKGSEMSKIEMLSQLVAYMNLPLMVTPVEVAVLKGTKPAYSTSGDVNPPSEGVWACAAGTELDKPKPAVIKKHESSNAIFFTGVSSMGGYIS
jgi:hypothetical protein